MQAGEAATSAPFRSSTEYEAQLEGARHWSPPRLQKSFVSTAVAVQVEEALQRAAPIVSNTAAAPDPRDGVGEEETVETAGGQPLSRGRAAIMSAVDPQALTDENATGGDGGGSDGADRQSAAAARRKEAMLVDPIGFGAAAESCLVADRNALIGSTRRDEAETGEAEDTVAEAGGNGNGAEGSASVAEVAYPRVMLVATVDEHAATTPTTCRSAEELNAEVTATQEEEEVTPAAPEGDSDDEAVPPLIIPSAIANDSPHYLLLLHQEAMYRKLMLQELDMGFVTIAERGWFQRDVLLLSEAQMEAYGTAIVGGEAGDRAAIGRAMAEDRHVTLLLTERKRLGGDELMARREINAEEDAQWAEFSTRGLRDRFWLVGRAERQSKIDAGEDMFGGIELPPDALRPETPEMTYEESLLHDAKRSLQPAPPNQSRMAAYKAQRRYRQDADYRRAVEKERAFQEAAARYAAQNTITPTVAGSSGFASGRVGGDHTCSISTSGYGGSTAAGTVSGGSRPIDKMVAAFSAPDNLAGAMATIEHCEAAERNLLVKGRSMWLTTLLSYHRRYRALTVDGYREALTALTNEEAVGRAGIVNQYGFMMLEFCEALEILHRRDLIISEIPKATAVVASKERRSWLHFRRQEMQRKDEEHQRGEEHDAMMRRKYFDWTFAMLQARSNIEKAESESRVATIYNKQRKAFQTIAELANLEYPIVLAKHLKRKALYDRLSTVVEWTPESYDRVYLGEASGRGDIARRQKEVWTRIMGDEAKEYLVARREEVTNLEVHRVMAAYDARAQLNTSPTPPFSSPSPSPSASAGFGAASTRLAGANGSDPSTPLVPAPPKIPRA